MTETTLPEQEAHDQVETNGAATVEAQAATDLSAELDQAKAKAAEYLEGWQRARAEMANYRRRTEAERLTLTQAANARLLTRLLPVLDDFERAFETLPADLRNLTWIQGMGHIYRKLQGVVESEGATPIESVGKPFDPNVHEALMQEPSTDFPEGVIIAEFQRGYTLGDRVLRPGMVKVSAGPGSASQQQTEASASTDNVKKEE